MTAADMRMVELLLVEDNPGDVRLTQEALREGKLHNRLSLVGDGVEALAFLRHVGRYASAPRPDLILLDLGLPRKDGHEVIRELLDDPVLRAIPVAVLTASPENTDILISQRVPVRYFLTKPVDVGQLIALVATVRAFGLAIVRPPDDRADRRDRMVRASPAGRGAYASAQAARAMAQRELRVAKAAYELAYGALL
jgi:chemotaxis family two-component system response regulator Rcp1